MPERALALSPEAGQTAADIAEFLMQVNKTLEEEEKAGAERPSVVLLRSRTRQPVWNLAKKYGTTVEAIRQANRLEADLAEEGELLLIPM